LTVSWNAASGASETTSNPLRTLWQPRSLASFGVRCFSSRQAIADACFELSHRFFAAADTFLPSIMTKNCQGELQLHIRHCGWFRQLWFRSLKTSYTLRAQHDFRGLFLNRRRKESGGITHVVVWITLMACQNCEYVM
jgi:hypothetical protein